MMTGPVAGWRMQYSEGRLGGGTHWLVRSTAGRAHAN